MSTAAINTYCDIWAIPQPSIPATNKLWYLDNTMAIDTCHKHTVISGQYHGHWYLPYTYCDIWAIPRPLIPATNKILWYLGSTAAFDTRHKHTVMSGQYDGRWYLPHTTYCDIWAIPRPLIPATYILWCMGNITTVDTCHKHTVMSARRYYGHLSSFSIPCRLLRSLISSFPGLRWPHTRQMPWGLYQSNLHTWKPMLYPLDHLTIYTKGGWMTSPEHGLDVHLVWVDLYVHWDTRKAATLQDSSISTCMYPGHGTNVISVKQYYSH